MNAKWLWIMIFELRLCFWTDSMSSMNFAILAILLKGKRFRFQTNFLNFHNYKVSVFKFMYARLASKNKNSKNSRKQEFFDENSEKLSLKLFNFSRKTRAGLFAWIFNSLENESCQQVTRDWWNSRAHEPSSLHYDSVFGLSRLRSSRWRTTLNLLKLSFYLAKESDSLNNP